MKALLMCDGRVGNKIAQWLMEHYPEDIGALVSIGESEAYLGAKNLGIPSFVFESESLLLAALTVEARFDIGLLAWWPKIISPSIRALAAQGFINTHPSLLPYNRGKHYNFWAIVEDAPFGVSLHYVADGIDNGDVVAQQPICCGWEDTGETLYIKAAEAMIDLFTSAYPALRQGGLPRIPQDLNKGSLHYAKEIDAASTIDLDKSYTARELINLPLLNFEWVTVDCNGSPRPGVKGGRSPAQRTLDAWNWAIRWSMAGCGAVTHPAIETRAEIG